MRALDPSTFIGYTYGSLKIVSEAKRAASGRRRITAICQCGVMKDYDLTNLKNGTTVSCGCHKLKICIERLTKHGLRGHPLSSIWKNIKGRCERKSHPRYPDYGALGVRMCQEWREDFKVFHDWCINNGWKKGLDLDKDIIAKKLGVPPLLYSPDRCCFVTRRENNGERRSNIWLEHDGKKMIISNWERELGLNSGVIKRRLKRGWSIAEALSTPKLKGGQKIKNRRS